MWGFPKTRGTILGVPIIRTIVYWGLYWGPLILGNYHVMYLELEASAFGNFWGSRVRGKEFNKCKHSLTSVL